MSNYWEGGNNMKNKMNERLEILVIEDTPKHVWSARMLLGKEHNLSIASDYKEGMEYLNSRKHYDVLLTDMMFPFGDCKSTKDTLEARPLGYAIGLYAARPFVGVPLIGILTDLNHHSNAIGATFDDFRGPRKGIPTDRLSTEPGKYFGLEDELL